MRVGWNEKPLGEVLQLEYGKPLDEVDRKPDGRYPVYGANGEKGRTDRSYCDKPSIIVGRKGSAGEVNLTEPKFWPLDVTYFVTFDDRQHDLRFLFYLLTKLDLTRLAKGVKPGINRNEVYAQIAKIPPREEQRRIVGILDEAFDGIATAKANTEKNLQNARALFESHLHAALERLWESCEIVPLSDLASEITDGDHLPPPKSDVGVPFITIGDIDKKTRIIDFSETFMVPQSYFDRVKDTRKPKRGDVLYTVTGSFGIPVIIHDDVEFCFQRHIALVRPKAETQSAWLYYLLLSPQVFEQASERATGAAQKTISLKVLRNLKVPRVSPARQRTVVDVLDALGAHTQRLEGIYRRKLAALDELKKSLLHQAFSGQL